MVSWAVLAILAALIWTIVTILDKYVISHELRDPIVATFTSGAGAFLILSTVSSTMSEISFSLENVISALIAGVSYSFAIWLYYLSMGKEEVSRLAPIFTASPLFVLIIAFMFLGERLTALNYFGVILMVSGAILISFRKHTKKLRKQLPIIIAAISALFIAFRNIAIKYATVHANVWATVFWMGVGSGLVSLMLFVYHHPHIRKKAKKGVKHVFLIGALSAAALLTFSHALSVGSVSLVSALISTQPLFVFLVATMLSKFRPKFLKEKITKPIIIQKLIAIALILAGSILII